MFRRRYFLGIALVVAAGAARGDFLTERWGNDATCRHRGTAALQDRVLKFDLSSLPGGAKVYRAVFVPAVARRDYSGTIRFSPVLAPAEQAGGEPKRGEALALRAPLFQSFDATACVRTWAADPAKNLGLYLEFAPGVQADNAVLEISYEGTSEKPVAPVTDLKALHQAGQSFLTFKEIEDPVADDAPKFEPFHNAVLEAGKKRSIVYRVYRSDKPITVRTLGEAELVREIPEILTCWNLKAVANTEHPDQGTPTMKSPLRPGYNNARNHVMTRYLITDPGQPLPRATGLCVLTVTEPGKRYYAVTAAVNGTEAVRDLGAGASLAEPVDEKTSPFPAIVYQRTVGKKERGSFQVDVYNSWIGPPYHNLPNEAETYIVRWEDLPQGSEQNRLPLWVVCGTYGSTAGEMQNPGWYGARKYITGAFTIGLAEGGIWQGFHECIGTLKSYDQGVVHNYPQRRVLGAAAWGVWKKDFFIDPQRVYHWAQLGSWALRHGDVFAVVMSNGYGNLAVGKLAQNYSAVFGTGPLGSKNWLGVPQWEYADLPKWIRENPTVELPYWICSPAYGAYPAHTIGDFGFLPWPETFHAMHSTKRAFAAIWNSNGPGQTAPLLPIVTRIRREQSLPAFGNSNLDASPGDGDHDDAEKSGGINLYQLWDPETIVDEPARWEITLYLRSDSPADECVTDLTPRRSQKFKAKPGQKFQWTCRRLEGPLPPKIGPAGPAVPTTQPGGVVQSGTATADQWGLVTIEGLKIGRSPIRVSIEGK